MPVCQTITKQRRQQCQFILRFLFDDNLDQLLPDSLEIFKKSKIGCHHYQSSWNRYR